MSSTAALRQAADSASLARLEALPQSLLTQARKVGFATALRDLIISALGAEASPTNQAPDFTISALADSKSEAAVDFHNAVRKFPKEEARLVKVTTFALIGFEIWSFGELKADVQGELVPAEIRTVDTVREGGQSERLALKVTSRLGIYENASELSELGTASAVSNDLDDRLEAIFTPRVPSRLAFSRINALPTRTGFIRFTGEARSERASQADESFIETLTDVRRVNPSNMTCATCHRANVRGIRLLRTELSLKFASTARLVA